MRVETFLVTDPQALPATSLPGAQLVLAFGSAACLDAIALNMWRKNWPGAHILGCSTAGEIHGTRLHDNAASLAAIEFESSSVSLVTAIAADNTQSEAVGRQLGNALGKEGLRHVLLLSDGLQVNGTALLTGLRAALPPGTSVSGGMAGDGEHFSSTFVVANGPPLIGQVAALGFYGDKLRVGFGSLGGWDAFGPIRLITRSEGNVLHELDGESALALYKRYLGPHAEQLPASALRFPLALRTTPDSPHSLVRTILSIDESTQTVAFAGDIPEGQYVQLMRANFDRLIEGAQNAALQSAASLGSSPKLALLISCVGRRLIMGQRVEEEIEQVGRVVGPDCQLTGFYSYGEFSPLLGSVNCELHNQTMTITVFDEA